MFHSNGLSPAAEAVFYFPVKFSFREQTGSKVFTIIDCCHIFYRLNLLSLHYFQDPLGKSSANKLQQQLLQSLTPLTTGRDAWLDILLEPSAGNVIVCS